MEDIEIIEIEAETMASNIAKVKQHIKRRKAEIIEAMQATEGTTGYIAPDDLQYGY